MPKTDPHVPRIRKAGDRRKPKPGRTREETEFARKLRREVSRTEDKLWPHLRSSKLGAPFRQQHVINHRYPDYCCVPLKLIVEIDGPTHDLHRDTARDHRMNRRGYDVIRFSVQEIDQNLQGVVNTIYDAIRLRLMAKQAGEKNTRLN
ncbi:MAG TPA: DUF559 domain-containing protein [Hyphomonadaceae bacterium]|jgi:very-short-patch-repair endonuclease|nr:DUF559 domain-containing protein [Hyphomonadaceae bacterium]